MLSRDLPSLDDEGLLSHLGDAGELIGKGEYIHFVLWIAYALPLYELGMACEQLLGWDALQAFTLLSGTSEASSAPGRALTDLADGGGVLAHAAVIAREYGIPAVLATGDATRRLRAGRVVTVDGSSGVITVTGSG